MKIMVATDMEGVGGVFTSDQTGKTIRRTDENYDYWMEARRLLTEEVNAAVQGAKDGGCDEVVVWDGHSSGSNFVVEMLHPEGEYIIGTGYRDWIPLDESYDAMALLGFHAMAGTPNGVLEHTQSYETSCTRSTGSRWERSARRRWSPDISVFRWSSSPAMMRDARRRRSCSGITS